MDSKIKIYLTRAEDEIRLAKTMFNLSDKPNIKKILGANPDDSFYSSVISHAYYSIFYCTKAYLLFKDYKFSEQGQHQAVYFGFKKLVLQGIVDKELLELYEKVLIKASALLEIFKEERFKRTNFTYQTIPQANIGPAKESIENAIKFVSILKGILEK
jgi:uncharacterized protein (UPF0332 family)